MRDNARPPLTLPLETLVTLALIVAVLIGSAVINSMNVLRLYRDNQFVAHTHEVLATLEGILSQAKDAEAGQRGFVITGREAYLEPYESSRTQIQVMMQRLRTMTTDNAELQARLPEVQELIDHRFATLQDVIRIRRDDGFDAASASILSDRGKDEMDALRTHIGDLVAAAQRLLAQRAATSEQTFQSVKTTGLISAVLGLGLVGGYGYLSLRILRLRTLAAASLFQERELLRVTLASIGDGMISTDLQGRVTFLNPIAETLCGWSTDEARGQPLDVVFRIVNETTRQPVENPALRALSEGVIVGLANHTVLISRSGSECAIADSAAPIHGVNGQLLGSVLVFRDVTVEREQERALRNSEAKMRQLADTMPQIVWVARPDGYLEYYNQKWYEYTGCQPEECLGYHENVWIHPDDRENSQKLWRECLHNGKNFEIERRLKGRAGEYRWFLGRALPIHDEIGKIARWFGTSTDITDRKLLEDNLRVVAADLSEANRRKNEFLATLAHELRNPLAPIRTGLELMKYALNDPKTIEETRRMMERQSAQMVRLIDDLLDISRITQGKLQLRKAQIELSEVIKSSIEATQPFIVESNQSLEVLLPDSPLLLNADPNRLAQVFSNLLSNASKYTPEGGEIQLSAAREGDQAVVRVRDSGLGIPPEMQDRVFEMFAQIDRPLEKGYPGLGIGLTLVKRLVEMHKGQVDVFSEGTGRGSEFTVRLPIFSAVQETFDVSSASAAPLKSLQTYKILVVDDNRAAAETLGQVLKILGHEVIVAHDGLEGWEAAEHHQPEIVLMDLGMPKLNGFEAARKIRETDWGRQIYLIALTGWGQDQDQQHTRDAGFDYHLTKPADPAMLQSLLNNLERKP